jgi:tetratricopeptide (TPR) repeat protein
MPAAGPRASGTVREQRAADTKESRAARPLAQDPPMDHVVVGAIPQQPPGFQPRPDLLARLNRAGPGVSVLTGRPGVGKTQLAAAHARAKLTWGWRLVAWVNAGNTGSLLGGLVGLAEAIGLSDGIGHEAADAGRAVRRWLETDGDRCLLVFDDAEDPDLLRPFIPAGGRAEVLITSAQPLVVNLGTRVPVEVFSPDEALAFLGGRTGLADERTAAALAAELGYLPVALTQAAAVIAAEHLEYETYLERLWSLSVEEYLTARHEQPYPRRVARVVLLSLDAARAADSAGVSTRVMEITAVLSGAKVNRELLHAMGVAGVLASRGDAVAAAVVDRALTQLAERSLLAFSLDGQTIIAHRLVTQMVRDELLHKQRLTAVCRAAASVLEARAAALAGSQDRHAARDILEQVAALLDNASGPASQTDEELAKALLRLRFFALYHLIELGDNAAQAVAVGQQLTADFERVLGRHHPDTLNSRNSLAAAYQLAGQPAAAIPLFEVTLATQERVLGPDHPDTLTSRNNLGAAYQLAGRPAEAIPLFQLTLAARERVLGADHPKTLNSRGSLAAAYRDAGQLAEALPLFELTLSARERVLGVNHPDTLTSRNNLAAAYREAGRVAEALPLFELTLSARERVLGVNHPDTLTSRNNLAAAYREAGRVAEAIPLIEQTLAAQEQLLGADHPKTLASRNNLATAYRDTGRPAEAIPLYERNLTACERLLGADHPRTLSTRKNLASAYQEAGQAEEAAYGNTRSSPAELLTFRVQSN